MSFLTWRGDGSVASSHTGSSLQSWWWRAGDSPAAFAGHDRAPSAPAPRDTSGVPATHAPAAANSPAVTRTTPELLSSKLQPPCAAHGQERPPEIRSTFPALKLTPNDARVSATRKTPPISILCFLEKDLEKLLVSGRVLKWSMGRNSPEVFIQLL